VPMKWFFRILTLLVVVSVVELYLLIQLHRHTNLWATMAMILVPGIAGSWLIRREGGGAWRRLRRRLDSGGLPAHELLDGVVVLVAGTLLITPGVLTDLTGLLLLVPAVRRRLRRHLLARARRAHPDSLLALLLTDDETPLTPPTAPAWQGRSREVPHYAERPGDAP
jgi:UPF0716 protein FxsA